jgi:hypothetical protein
MIEVQLAFFMAVVAFVLALIFGDQITALLATIGAMLFILPVVLVFTQAAFGMIGSDAATASNISESTTSWMVSYLSAKLPSIIISEMAGAVVGAFGGLVVRALRSLA